MKKLRVRKWPAIGAGPGAEIHGDQHGVRKIFGNVSFDQPRRSVKMNDERDRFVGIDARTGK